AGGGSVVHVDGQRLQVGPASAGADPGPACYQRGGPATVTDANLLLGRLRPEAFPALFGPSGDRPLDPAPSAARFEALVAQLTAPGTSPPQLEHLAEGALAIAVARMAGAIRRISIQRGHDLRNASLVCFGGAGGQHACALAEALGMAQVLLHPLAGVLSAYGMGLAEERLIRERSVLEPLDEACVKRLHELAEHLDGEALPGSSRRVTAWLRLRGAEVSLPVPLESLAAMRRSFLESHQQRYGYSPVGVGGQPVALEVEWLSVERVAAGSPLAEPAQQPGGDPQGPEGRPAMVPLYIDGAWRPATLLPRERMRAGDQLSGPALITEATGTVLVAQGWGAQVLAGGELLLRHLPSGAGRAGAHGVDARSDDPVPADSVAAEPVAANPVLLELFHHRFAAIAEQMGERLRLTSTSVNIRERLDFSCALFDRDGDLVANAPHIPVHLGSMGESVASLLAAVARGERQPLAPGDAVVSNDPYNGGTHLPDLTVITPVFAGAGEPLFFVASRGHHADVGGLTPGSMPPDSCRIEEEGLLLDNVPFLEQGAFPEAIWRQRLAAGDWPVRNPDLLLADLHAQVAANRLGASELERLVAGEGLERVVAYMGHIQDNAAEAVR
ncbi:MAG: hydantoinase B/oxoprolinase family protein, partial [Prochlorococcaceae cyanobacterium]